MDDLIQNRLYNTEIEQSIIGSLIVDPNLLVDISYKLKETDFYHRRNQLIYRVLKSHMDQFSNIQLDLTILVDILKNENYIEDVGGLEYISTLAEFAYSTSNIDYYIKSLIEYSNKRKLSNLAREINRNIEENKMTADELLEDVQKDISDLANQTTSSGLMTISEVIQNDMQSIQERLANKDILTLKTDFHQYDDVTNGLKPGTLLILAARPAMGKTALALNMALNVARKNKKRVLIFSLEMGEEELLKRLVSIQSQVKASHISNNTFIQNEDEMLKYQQALNQLSKLDILIDATATSTISSIKNKCREAMRRYDKLDFIVIDYLQLITGSNSRGTREQEISEISRGLKLLSKELKVPILALSQLSRRVESREGRPMLSDLRESGSIEQDADQVMFLYSTKDRIQNKNDQNSLDPIELILAKHRSGSTANILLLFDKSIQTFKNPSKETINEYYSNNISD